MKLNIHFVFVISGLLLLAGLNRSFSQSLSQADSLQQKIKEYDLKKEKSGITTLSLKDTLKTRILNDLAYTYYKMYSDETLTVSNQMLSLSEKINYQTGIADACHVLGLYYSATGNVPKALEYNKRALGIRLKHGTLTTRMHSYTNVGVLYSLQGNSPESLNHYIKGLEIAKKLGDIKSMAALYNNISVIYLNRQNYTEAKKNCENSLKLYLKAKDEYNIAIAYQNLGNIYIESGAHQKALDHYRKGIAIGGKSNNLEAVANNNEGVGKALYELSDYKNARKAFDKSLEIRQKIGDTIGIATSYIALARTETKLGHIHKALDYGKKSMAMGTQTGSLDLQRQIYKYMAETYEAAGDYKNAYMNHVAYKKANDSIFNQEREKKITEMQMNYDFKKKQDAQKLQQQKKDAVVELESRKQRNTTYFVLLVLGLVSIFAFGIYVNLKRNLRQKKTIEKQNLQIQDSLTEKETLLREIHHRVKNNLQIISSLLNIQSETIADKNVLASIQEGQSRVQAMSLIHQNLYQSEHINNVNIENYLKELIDYLAQMFDNDSKKIEVSIAAAELEFDIDTAIPLGLIVNELVSNVYKYAFEARNEGKIDIVIKPIDRSHFELQVSNNGIPLPDGFELKNNKSLGLKLVSMLSRQLRGKFTFESGSGITSFVVSFRHP